MANNAKLQNFHFLPGCFDISLMRRLRSIRRVSKVVKSIIFVVYVLCLSCCHVCHCSIVATCWEKANLLALLYVMFSCVYVTFPSGVMGQVWYLIVSIPDFRRRPYLHVYQVLLKIPVVECSH